MPVALRNRLAEEKDEVLRYARLFGRFKAMDKFGVHDTIAFDRLLMEWTGNEKYGYNPELKLENTQALSDQLLEAVLRKINTLQDRLEKQDELIKFYRNKESDQNKRIANEKAIDKLIRVCEIN